MICFNNALEKPYFDDEAIIKKKISDIKTPFDTPKSEGVFVITIKHLP